MLVAIQPDNYGPDDASSPRWAELLAGAGHGVRWVNVGRPDILEQLRGCDAFLWRWGHVGGMAAIARRVLPVVERELGLLIYPDQDTCWHYDDKVAQYYLLAAHGIAAPRTWVWFDAHAARDWARTAPYPVVLKLATGAGSTNVRLVRHEGECRAWIERLFGDGVFSLDEQAFRGWRWSRRLRKAARLVIQRSAPWQPLPPGELHRGYIYFQEFLPGNELDTRVTVIGNRAFAFRRHNRPGDFRASGSGRIDWDPAGVDERFIRLAFRTARATRSQSCAIDGLYRDGAPVVCEISYTYMSAAVERCPGHWVLEGDPDGGSLVWRAGHLWPEKAQITDLLERAGRGAARGSPRRQVA